MRSSFLVLVLAWASSACTRGPTEEASAQAGVFYGGQVQELKVLSLEREKLPSFGVRLKLQPLDRSRALKLSLTVPGPAGRRVRQLFEQSVPPGRSEFDLNLPLSADGPFGLYNVRAELDGQLLLDRALLVKKSLPEAKP